MFALRKAIGTSLTRKWREKESTLWTIRDGKSIYTPRWTTGPFGLFGVNNGDYDFAVCRCRNPVGQTSLGTIHPSRRPIRDSAARLPGH